MLYSGDDAAVGSVDEFNNAKPAPEVMSDGSEHIESLSSAINNNKGLGTICLIRA